MRYISRKLAGILFIALVVSQATADVKLPTILGDRMVLQRDQEIRIWGWADAGEKITVTLAGKDESVTADASGNWMVKFPAQKANKEGQKITIKGNNEITLSNILIGDIWIGSGQSNMQWGISQSEGGGAAMAQSANPNIRVYNVPREKSGQPKKDINALWQECDQGNLNGLGFSAVLYYFGRKVNAEADIPLGLIHSSWGGSPIEQWLTTGGGQMYNAMIAPLHNFKIKGLLWYQGESNVANGIGYYDKQKSLIDGWRGKWKDKNIPFYFVQLAPWANYKDGQLTATWEGQVKTLKISNTGMAVTTDIVHNIGDIHPKNKLDVGERLARWALARDYGKEITYSGPLYKSHKITGSKVFITFAHVGEGLASRDGQPLTEFMIAGEDGKFVEAVAEIEGKTVVVSAETVKTPKNVRFGWHKKANPNLMNKANLPASPFHTDNWQGGTGEQKLKIGPAKFRVFTTKSGSQVKAKYIKVLYGKVHLVGENGKKMAVRMTALSKPDIEYIKERMQK